jgi:signal transduction histidine kinase
MTLRSRVALSLLVITALLIAPAIYGLFVLGQLRDITQDLRTRDAVGALALGRLQTSFGEVTNWQRNYWALAGDEAAQERVVVHSAEVENELTRLEEAGYAEETQLTRERWRRAQQAMERERELIAAGQLTQAETHRRQVLEPAFEAVAATIEPIGQAINRTGEAQVQRAADLATRAATTTLIALFLALILAIIIAGLLTRSLLRPIHELRRGMSVVAAGEFEPQLGIPPNRPDELGDLARSFQRMTQQLAELDRLQAEFVSVASHELKTPLSVIKGYVALLHEGIYGEIAEQQRKVLGSVSEQADRLGRLIQQLLDISRFEAGGGRLELRPVSLRGFLTELATSFEALAVQNQIDFQVETASDLPDTLVGDPDRLNEVMGNLLSNAFKFTPRGGGIRLRAERANGGIAVEVRDNGIGIPHDQLPRIFEKFYQVDNEAHPKSLGSGLGLAISREIVEAHGGTIAAESEEGRGTTFRVFLPQNSVSS